MFFIIVLPQNLAIFTGKHLCWSFNKVARLNKNSFFIEHLLWLFLFLEFKHKEMAVLPISTAVLNGQMDSS